MNLTKNSSYRKSRRSINNGACVEVGTGAGMVGIRDTQNRDMTLEVTANAWRNFITGIK